MRVIMNDGTMFEHGIVGASVSLLWLYIPDITMQEGVSIAFDTNKTSRIVYQYGEEESVYEGFTVCKRIIDADDGTISIALAKGS